jgi:uncharacterized protein YjbJ (UPF0337 family)
LPQLGGLGRSPQITNRGCGGRLGEHELITLIRNQGRKLSYTEREVHFMGEHNSGPEEAIKGVVEGVKGKAKEVGGTLAGRNDIIEEGKAQQDKADAQRDAAKKEAEAEAARGGAKAAEERQKANQ